MIDTYSLTPLEKEFIALKDKIEKEGGTEELKAELEKIRDELTNRAMLEVFNS